MGTSIQEIVQEVGVNQGDNMAPVLFLLLTNAFVDSLEQIWEETGFQKVQVQRASGKDFKNGKVGEVVKSHVKPQYKAAKLEPLTIF